MKCTILHETPGRLRFHLHCSGMTLHQADVLEYYLRSMNGINNVKVYDRTCDAVVVYSTERKSVISAMAAFSFKREEALNRVPERTARALNREFEDRLVAAVISRCVPRVFFANAVYRSFNCISLFKVYPRGTSGVTARKTFRIGA